MKSPKATKRNQQNDKMLGKPGNQRSGTSLFQTRPRFYFLIIVVKNHFADIEFIFLISHPTQTLNYSILHLEKKIGTNWEISAQWKVVLCQNVWLNQIQKLPIALGSTSSPILGQPRSSKFSTSLSNKKPRIFLFSGLLAK